MLQGSDCSRYTIETCRELGVFLQVDLQDFNSEIALQLRIQRLPNFACSTLPQPLAQFIFSKTLWTCTHTRPLFSKCTPLEVQPGLDQWGCQRITFKNSPNPNDCQYNNS